MNVTSFEEQEPRELSLSLQATLTLTKVLALEETEFELKG